MVVGHLELLQFISSKNRRKVAVAGKGRLRPMMLQRPVGGSSKSQAVSKKEEEVEDGIAVSAELLDGYATEEEEESFGFVHWRKDMVFAHRVPGTDSGSEETEWNIALKATKGLLHVIKTIHSDPAIHESSQLASDSSCKLQHHPN